MPTVKFVKEKKEIEVPRGANLRRVAVDAGVNIYNGLNGMGASVNKVINCHGLGACGTCIVAITKGMENASKRGFLEASKCKFDPITSFHFIGNEDRLRLACYTKVEGDMEVETGPEFNLYGENFFS